MNGNESIYTFVPCRGCVWRGKQFGFKACCMLPRCVGRNGLLHSSASAVATPPHATPPHPCAGGTE